MRSAIENMLFKTELNTVLYEDLIISLTLISPCKLLKKKSLSKYFTRSSCKSFFICDVYVIYSSYFNWEYLRIFPVEVLSDPAGPLKDRHTHTHTHTKECGKDEATCSASF